MVEDDHTHDDAGDEEDEPAAPTWFDTSARTLCPSCGAEGAMALGEGVFCPTCGEVTTARRPRDDDTS